MTRWLANPDLDSRKEELITAYVDSARRLPEKGRNEAFARLREVAADAYASLTPLNPRYYRERIVDDGQGSLWVNEYEDSLRISILQAFGDPIPKSNEEIEQLVNPAQGLGTDF